jgi:hypothetical protein
VNDVTNAAASEDTMKLVLAIIGIAPVSTFAQTVKLSPVVPASWFLTDIPTQGALVTKLGGCYLRSGLCKGWITLLDDLVMGYFGDGGERSDPQTTVFH